MAGMPGRCHAAGAAGTSFDSGISSQPASDCAESQMAVYRARSSLFEPALFLLFVFLLVFTLFPVPALCLPSRELLWRGAGAGRTRWL